MTATERAVDLATEAALAAADKLATDVIAIDVSEQLSPSASRPRRAHTSRLGDSEREAADAAFLSSSCRTCG